jgi:NitT/TauT family transport system permease protein
MAEPPLIDLRGADDAQNDDPASDGAQARRVRDYSIIIGIHVAVVALWQVAVDFWGISSFILPSPLAMLGTLAKPDYHWFANTFATAQEVVGGYALAVVLGVGIALVFSWSRVLSLTLFPLFVTLNMVPKIALGPLIIVWLGYGLGPNIVITFAISFFPVLLNTLRGLSEVEPDLLDLVRALKGSRWQVFTKVQLPGSLPYIFSGMKVAAILAIAGAVVGEFIGSERGLGFLMVQVQTSLDTGAMFMAVVLLTLVGVAVYLITIGLERLCVVKDARLR